MTIRLLLVILLLSFGKQQFSQCQNIGFELGDFTNWIGQASAGPNCPQNTWNGIPPCPLPGERFKIIVDTVPVPISDSCSDFLRTPPGKNTSVRVGNRLVGGEIDAITYVMDVTPQNNFLLYEYAAIMEDPINIPHAENERPAFYVDITPYGDTVPDTCNSIYEWANPTDIGLRTCNIAGNVGSNQAFYRPWTKVGVDLRDYQYLPPPQNQVTITFRSRDCQLCGHFGYGFFYAQCDSLGIEVEYCENNNYANLRAPEGFTYRWMDSNTTREIVINNPNEGDTVWVDLETRGGCTSRLYAVLKAFRTVANFTSVDTVCAGDTIQFNNYSYAQYVASGDSIELVDYYWNFGDGDTAVTRNAKHVYTSPGTYDVILKVAAKDGCLDSITKQIIVGDIPVVDFDFDDVCDGEIAHFVDWSNALTTITDWSWNFGEPTSSSNTSSLKNPTHLYQTWGKYQVTLEVGNTFGCFASKQDSIEVFKNPIGQFSYVLPCVGDTTLFYVIPDSINGLAACFWDFGDGFTSTLFNPKHDYISAGNYTVTLKVTDSNGCDDEITQTVRIDDLAVDFSPASFCLNAPYLFTGTANLPLVQTNWDFDDGTFSNQLSYLKSFNVAGTYNVQFKGETAEGCRDSIVKSIQIYELPEAQFAVEEKYGCELLCTDFYNLSNSFFGISTYRWSFGDNSFSNDTNPTHCYQDTGLFDVQLIITSNVGCSDTLTKFSLIEVSPRPEADFDVYPELVPIFDPVVSLNNTSIRENYIEWYFGDSVGYFGNSLNYTLPNELLRAYEICLKAFSNPNCYDSICKTVELYGDLVYVPNAFTPNGDGINDVITPNVFGLAQDGYHFMVFNRWGELLFETKTIDEGWNGKYKNQLCKDDVYVWKLKGKVEKTGERLEIYGHVSLLKKGLD